MNLKLFSDGPKSKGQTALEYLLIIAGAIAIAAIAVRPIGQIAAAVEAAEDVLRRARSAAQCAERQDKHDRQECRSAPHSGDSLRPRAHE